MKPGQELDERVSRLLGWEPSLRWGVGKPEERSWVFTGDKWACEEWLADLMERIPDSWVIKGSVVYSVEDWPAVSTDGHVMLRAIDAMRERGWYYDASNVITCQSHEATFSDRGGQSIRMEGETLPHAISRAIWAALGGVG